MKLAACFTSSAVDAGAVVERLLVAQQTRSHHRAQFAFGSAGAAGVVVTDTSTNLEPWLAPADSGNLLLVSGVPVPVAGGLSSWLADLAHLPVADAARRFAGADGAFAALVWNPAEPTCHVVTDMLGMQPLYMVRRPGVFAIASDARALTTSGLIEYAMSPAGWGSFLTLQHPIAGGTLAEGVVRVPPGSVLSYDARTDRLSCTTHSPWPAPMSPADVDDRFVDRLATAFVDDVQRYHSSYPDATLLLSGGYDSRLILAALAELGGRPGALAHAHDDELFGLDGYLASAAGRHFGVEARCVRSPRDYFSSPEYVEYLIASDVSVQSLGLFIAQLTHALRGTAGAVWEATFPGCMLFPVHQPPGSFERYLSGELAPAASRWAAAARVFDPDALAAMRAAFDATLQAETAKYQDDEHGVSQFIVRNRTRQRIAINALQVYANEVTTLTPGLSREFWQRAAAVPYSLKAGHALYHRLLRRAFPRATRVPVLSAGRVHPLDSGLGWRWLQPAVAARLSDPRLLRLLWRAGIRSGAYYWAPSALVDRAIAEIDVEAPGLNREGISGLRRARPPFDAATEAVRALVFYQHMATQVFTGRLPRAGATGALRPSLRSASALPVAPGGA